MACCKRPLWWFIGSGLLFLIGLALIIIAALAKTSLYDTVVHGVYSARYIDNTHQTSGCKTLILGDTTCAGARFKGWSMSSEDKYKTCMRDSAPSSKALASASKWCKNGKGGCKKPDSCKPGSKYVYYMFSVLNADEVLVGHPAEVREMEPISIRKSFDRFNIDKDQWDATGVAQWSETAQWELIDETQRPLLDQVVVVPNHLAFSAVPAAPSATTKASRVSADNMMYMVGASKFYTGLQRTLDEQIGSKMAFLGSIFSGESAIEWQTFVRDAYRAGTPILTLGKIFANFQNCQVLMNLIVFMNLLPGNADFFTQMMCTDAYKGNIALSGYAKILEMGKVRVTPEDGILFYEYEKNCRSVGVKPSYICTAEEICRNSHLSKEECMRPSLSETDADKLFQLFAQINDLEKSQYTPLLRKFMDSCEIDGHVIQPKSLCDQVHVQLQKAGKAAMFSANPQSSDAVMAAYGWTDRSVAAQMIPYFVNGTIAQIMNYNGMGLPADPTSGYTFGVRGWTNTVQADVDLSLFTRQQVSSKFGQKGLNYFKSAMGMDHSCAFDYGCMTQASFKADGKTCVPDASCTPNYADGFDTGVVPGVLFDSEWGTRDFHGEGKTKTMFVSDMFIQADFTQIISNYRWGNIDVDTWNISRVAMRTENCDKEDLNRGIDCTSPIGTLNLGYNAGYASGKSPLEVVLPIYSSYPHFKLVTPDQPRVDTYNPVDPSKLIIHSCASCPADRDFNTILWTDPQSGMHVKGSQKIQLSFRVSANPANITRFPQSDEVLTQQGSVAMDPSVDLMIPVYWVDKYEVAAQYQKDQVESVQTLPSTFNIIFWVCLWVGLAVLAVGGFILWKGLKLRRVALLHGTSRAHLSLSALSSKVDSVNEREPTDPSANTQSV